MRLGPRDQEASLPAVVADIWGHRQVQKYIDDEDGVDKVKEEDDGVVALGGGRTRIYMGDVDGVGQVKKEGEGVKLGGGQTRVDIG